MEITIYTDGSCLRNGQEGAKAGWAAVLKCGENWKQFSGKIEAEKPTNNIAELTAVISAIRKIKAGTKANVTIICDSEYVTKSINEKRVHTWARNNWITASKKPVSNVDLWKELIAVCREYKECTFSFEDVAGHSGDIWNELCDKLAKEAAA